MQATIRIKGMSCQHCVKAVDGALRALPGVDVDEVTIGTAVISSQGEIDMAKVREAIEEHGFELA